MGGVGRSRRNERSRRRNERIRRKGRRKSRGKRGKLREEEKIEGRGIYREKGGCLEGGVGS